MYPLLEPIDDPAALRRLDARALPRARARAARVPARLGRADRRPPVVEPRHRRAHDRAALRVRHAARPHRLGRRPPDLRAQDPDRPARGDEPAAHGRRAVGLSAARRRASTTPSAPRTRRRRSRRRSAWRSPRKRKGEDAQVVAVIGDGAMSAGMAFEALNNAGTAGADLLVDPERQRDVDLASRSARSTTTSRKLLVVAALQHGAPRRQGSAGEAAAGARSSRKRAEEHMKGMVLPGTLFEEFGFNYIGPIDGHDVDVLVRTLANVRELQGSAAPARDHAKGPRLRARRGRSDPLPRRHAVRSRPSASSPKPAARARVHADLRRLAVRHGGARPAAGRHHAGDARGLGPRALLAGVPGPLLRRRHRRAARGHLRRRARLRGHEAGGRDLLDVPAARLRPADPRRRAAEPAGGVRDRPRRHRRRRRRDAHRRLRPFVPALPAQHDGDGAGRRERVPADALHGVHAGHADRGALSARQRARASRSRRR